MNWKKVLSLLLALSMMFSLATPAYAMEPAGDQTEPVETAYEEPVEDMAADEPADEPEAGPVDLSGEDPVETSEDDEIIVPEDDDIVVPEDDEIDVFEDEEGFDFEVQGTGGGDDDVSEDDDAPDFPTANVVQVTPPTKRVPVKTLAGMAQPEYSQVTDLGVEYRFTAVEPTDEQLEYFSDWNCDYRVTFSADMAAESFGLYGKYASYEGAFLFPENVIAGQSYYLLQAALGDGYTFTYDDVLTYVDVFDCGAFNLNENNVGKSMTVELVMWKDGVTQVIGTRTYTFGVPTTVRPAVPAYPEAEVTVVTPPAKNVPVKPLDGIMGDSFSQVVDLGAEYRFAMVEPSEDQIAYYDNWFCDYRVSFNAPLAAESFGLYGKYGGFEGAFLIPVDVEAGTEYYLLKTAVGASNFTYGDVRQFVQVFDCGVFNLSADNRNAGKIMTVDLVMWKDGVEPVVIETKTYSFDDLTTVRDVDLTVPTATVEQVSPAAKDVPVKTLEGLTGDDYDQIVNLGVEYKFTAVEPTDEQLAYYSDWNCDYSVTFDQALAAKSFGLYGKYGDYEGAFLFPTAVTAGQSVNLLQRAFGNDYTFTYNDVLDLVQVFDCGAFNLSEANQGATMTVELVMWKDGVDPVVLSSETYGFDDLAELRDARFTVSFDTDGGSEIAPVQVNNGAAVQKPEDPTKEDYVFSGWTLNDAAYDFSAPVTANITLKATWSAAVAKIGDTPYASLQDAIDAAHEMTGDVTVTLLADITEVAVVHQKAGLNLTVDGAGKTITGQLYIDGDGRYNGTDTLTIQNVKFAYDAATYDDAFIDVPSTKTAGRIYTTGKYNYAHNITVTNCEFAGSGTTTVAFRVASSAGANKVTLNALTVTGGHSFAQLVGVKDLTITGCTVTGTKNGINISGGEGTGTISGNTLIADATEGYTVRVKDACGMQVTLSGNTFSGGEGLVSTATSGGKIIVESGKYAGPLPTDPAKFTVNGGLFSVMPDPAVCGEGLYPVANTDEATKADYPYAVGEAVASVDGVGYLTFAEAVTAANNGEKVVKLLANITEAYTLQAGTLKVEKGEFTVTVNAPEGTVFTETTADGITTYTVAAAVAKIGDTLYASVADAVTASAVGDTVEVLIAGTYTLPGLPRNITVEGAVDGVVFKHTGSGNIAAIPNGASFRNVSFELGNNNYHGFQHNGGLTFENCTFDGKFFTYGNETYTNCTFNQSNSDYHMWVYGGDTITYSGCTFINEKTGKFLNVYSESGGAHQVIINDCTFVNNGTESKCAVNVKETSGNTLLGFNVQITGTNVVTGAFPENSKSDTTIYSGNGIYMVDDRKVGAEPKIHVTVNCTVNGVAVQEEYPEIVATVTSGDTTTNFATLQGALNAAHELTGDVTVALLADITEVAVVHQKAGLNLTIDGAGKTITGQLYIDGDGRYEGTDTLTIQNVKFAYDAATYDDAFIDVPSTKTAGKVYTTGKYNYAHNITVRNCEFAGEGTTTVAFRVASGAGAHGVTLDALTVTGGHSFAQLVGVKDLTITGCTVTGTKNGINISGGEGTGTISGNTLLANASETEGYTLRMKDACGMDVTLTGNTFSGVEGIINNASAGGKITVTSGKYAGPLPTDGEKFTVNGGIFSVMPDPAVCGEGLYPVANTDEATKADYPYAVGEAVASVDGVGYLTFAEAVTAANNGEKVITLLANVGDPYELALDETLKVNKNGHTFTAKAPVGPYVLKSSTPSDGVITYTVVEADIEYTNANGVTSYKAWSGTVVSANGTYKLLKDITATARINPGALASNVTLDLNGHTITSTANDCAVLLSRAGTASAHKTFAIIDSSEGQGGKIEVNPNANLGIDVQAKYNDVTIGEGVTINGNCVLLESENQTLNVNGTVNGGSNFAVVTNGSATKNATININSSAVLTSDGVAVYLPGTGTTTISGTVTGTTAVYQKSGTLNIVGATLTATGAAAPYTYYANGCYSTGDALVVDSCDYPGGAPVTNITGAVISSANNKEVAAYMGNGVTALSYVKADTDTLTIPDNEAWIAEDVGFRLAEGVTVTFDPANGEDVTAVRIEKGTAVSVPADPELEHYDFLGWYLGETAFDFETEVTEDITLTAKWSIEKIFVAYTNGMGNVYARYEVDYGADTPVYALSGALPTRPGFHLDENNLWTPAVAEKATEDVIYVLNWITDTPVPTATVVQITPPAKDVPVKTLDGLTQDAYNQVVDLGVEYVFTAVEPTAEQLEYFGDWNADYRVTFSKALAAESFGLYGKYGEYEGAFLYPAAVAAGEEVYLLQAAFGEGYTFTYNDVLNFVKAFDCGAFNLSEDNQDATMTVELVIWKDGVDPIVIKSRTYGFDDLTEVRDVVPELPAATVSRIVPPKQDVPVKTLEGLTGDDYDQIVNLGVEYKFTAVEPTAEQLAYYGNWNADYRVTFSADMAAESFGLYGQYGEYEGAFLFPTAVTAGQSVYLLQAALGDGYTFTYNDVLNFVKTFDCGAFNLSADNRNAALMTVELVIWKDGVDPIVISSETYGFEDLTTVRDVIPALPTATVEQVEPAAKDVPVKTVEGLTGDDYDKIVDLGVEYKFTAVEPTAEQLAYYSGWNCDYRVTFDQALAKESFGLYGRYGEYEGAFLFPTDVAAGQSVYLLQAAFGEGYTFTYSDVLNFVQVFDCGAFNLSADNQNATMTVELVMWTDGADPVVIASETYGFDDLTELRNTSYTVTFDSDGGTAVDAQTVTYKDKAEEPAAPEKEHYVFSGWTLDGADFDFDTPITGDITLKAKWGNEKVLVAYTDGMGLVYVRYEADYGTDTPVYTFTGALPARAGFHLDENNLWVPAIAEKATEDVIYVLNWITDTPVPTAAAVQITPPAKDVPVKTLDGLTQDAYNQVVDLGVEYLFTAMEPTDEQLAYFGDWNADYRVTFSKALAAESFGLYGKYGEYEGAFLFPKDVAAGEEVYLLQTALGDSSFTYNDVLTFVKVFDCGAFNLSADNQDATMTVELVIWKDGVSEPIVIKSRTYGFDDLTEVRDVVPDMPTATVSRILPPKQDVPVKTLEGLTGDDYDQIVNLGVEYKFTAVEPTAEQLAYYGNWNADYRVTFSAPMAAESFGLYGQYGEYEGAFLFPTDVAAGEEIYLLQAALGEGYTFTYNDVLNFVKVFDCGAFNLSADNRNAALMTVELVMWTDGVDPIVISSETYGFEDLTTVRDVIPALPTATVEQVEPAAKDVPVKTVAGLTGDDYDQIVDLGVEYKFTAVEPTAEQLAYYSGWNCDYRVTFDQALAAESFGLYGQYGEYEGAFLFPKDVAAGEEVYLLQAAFGEGYTFTYNDVLTFVKVFDCGAFNLSADNQDATMTVELVMWTDGAEPVVIASETYGFDDLTEVHNVSYTVSFNSDGGTAVAEQTVAYKGNAAEPTAPEKEHYVFGGWTLDGAAYDFATAVTADITLKAVWTGEEYTVTFDSDGGSAVEAQTVTYKDKATEPTAPDKEHYTFSGWTLDGAAYDFSAEVTADIELKAVWTPVDYKITFVIDEETIETTQTYGNPLEAPEVPAKPTQVFTGWEPALTETVEGAKVYTATWAGEEKTVIYANGMGGVLQKTIVRYGDDMPQFDNTITLPTRGGYRLDSNNLWTPPVTEETVTADVVYELNWIKQLTVTFMDGETKLKEVVVDEGGKVAQADFPADPTMEGYTFAGWYVGANVFDANVEVTANTVVTAEWQAEKRTVTFNSNGGSAVEPAVVDYGTPVAKPADPVKEYSICTGWTLNGEPYDFAAPVTGNITLVAVWTEDRAALVDAMIEAIGEVTLESEEAITAAREAYEALTDAEKERVTKLDVLEAAEAKLAALKVEDLINKIDDDPVTLASEEGIVAARAAYDTLTDAEKALVSEEAVAKLEAAEEALAALKAAAAAVDALIEAIPQPITRESFDEIRAARDAYNALSDELKPLVTKTAVLEQSEADSAALVQDMIDAIEEPVTLASAGAIKDARDAYNELTDEAKALVDPSRLDKLARLEEALEKLMGESDLVDGIKLSHEYIILNEGETLQLSVLGIEELGDVEITWSIENDTNDNNEGYAGDQIISVDKNGLVTALSPVRLENGKLMTTAYVKATALGTDNLYRYARCRVDVLAKDLGEDLVDYGVRLIDTKAKVPLFSTDYTGVRVQLTLLQDIVTTMADGDDAETEDLTIAAIESAVFANREAAKVFDLRVKDDRTLEIVPKSEFVINDAAKLKTIKSSYKTAITIMVDGKPYTTDQRLTLSVDKKQPKVTVKSVKLNSFYADMQKLNIKGGTVESIEAINAPTWLTLDGNELALRFNLGANNVNQKLKASTKLNLKVKLKGWAIASDVKISVSAAPTLPKMKFKPATLTVNPKTNDTAFTTWTITPAVFAEDEVLISKITEVKGGSYAPQEPAYEFTACDLVCEIDDGQLTVTTGENFNNATARTFKVFLSVDGVEYPVTVKTLKDATQVTMSVKASGSINLDIPKSPVKLTATIKNYNKGAAEYDITKIVALGTTEDVRDHFKIDPNGNVIVLTADDDLQIGDYEATVTATSSEGELLDTKIVKFKVTGSTKQLTATVTAKAKGNIDVLRPDSTSVILTPSFKNCYEYEFDSFTVQNKSKADVTEKFDYEPLDDGSIRIFIREGAAVSHADKYKISLKYKINNSDTKIIESKPVTLNVKQGKAAVSISSKKVTLFKNDRFSTGEVTIRITDPTLTGIKDIKFVSPKMNGVEIFEWRELGNGTYAIAFKDNTPPKADWKYKGGSVKIQVFLKGNETAKANVTFSVKATVG